MLHTTKLYHMVATWQPYICMWDYSNLNSPQQHLHCLHLLRSQWGIAQLPDCSPAWLHGAVLYTVAHTVVQKRTMNCPATIPFLSLAMCKRIPRMYDTVTPYTLHTLLINFYVLCSSVHIPAKPYTCNKKLNTILSVNWSGMIYGVGLPVSDSEW